MQHRYNWLGFTPESLICVTWTDTELSVLDRDVDRTPEITICFGVKSRKSSIYYENKLPQVVREAVGCIRVGDDPVLYGLACL
jgi:MinD superfamily P-loop ATPase